MDVKNATTEPSSDDLTFVAPIAARCIDANASAVAGSGKTLDSVEEKGGRNFPAGRPITAA
jgi:hypothetical protein